MKVEHVSIRRRGAVEGELLANLGAGAVPFGVALSRDDHSRIGDLHSSNEVVPDFASPRSRAGTGDLAEIALGRKG